MRADHSSTEFPCRYSKSKIVRNPAFTQGQRDLFTFVQARYAIKLARDAGLPPDQWTIDPILRRYRFTHIHREDDRVTRWLSANWRAKHADDPDLWFALTIFRRGFNNPSVGEELGYPVPWHQQHYLAVYARRKRERIPFLRPAYMTPGPANMGRGNQDGSMSGNLAELQVRYILSPLWKNRNYVRPRRGDSLAAFYGRLDEQFCCGGFYAAQVVADLKYAQLRRAPDWWTFAASGPGSRRGLNRVLGRPVDATWREEVWRAALAELQSAIDPLLAAARIPRLHAQDLQNCLCEFDKYERARLGQGKLRDYRTTAGAAVATSGEGWGKLRGRAYRC